jgi:hypothetical protein
MSGLDLEFKRFIEDQTGISEVVKKINARYDLIFTPKEIIPKVQKELVALSAMIDQKRTAYLAELNKAADSDERLKNLDDKTKLTFVAQRLIPEINASASLIREKYPGAIEFLFGENLNTSRDTFIKEARGIEITPSEAAKFTSGKKGKKKGKKGKKF